METKVCLCCGKPIEEGLWHSHCIKRFFGGDQLPEINFADIEQMAVHQLSESRGVAGVQEKLSLHIERNRGERPRLTIFGYPSGYILKPQSGKYKQLPEYEQTAMLLANLCGIQTVPHGLIPINDGRELAYITKRIDRDGVKKIHMEDFCQASETTTEMKYRSSYEACAALIDQFSKYALLDKVKFFSVLYFSFVIGNSDMHLKNFSFITDEQTGSLSLAPAYDLLPTKIILPSDHEDLGMLLNGQKYNLHKHDFDAFCAAVGINEIIQRKIMESIDRNVETMSQIIMDSTLNQDGKSRWIKMIAANIKRAKRP